MRNRVIGMALGLALAVGFLALSSNRPARTRWRLLPENEQAISCIAIQYTTESATYTAPCLKSFLKQADPGIDVIVACGNKADAASFNRWLRDENIKSPNRFRTVVVGVPITGWCKDRFLVASSSPSSLICPTVTESPLPTRTNDALVAPALERAFPHRFRSVQVPLRFDSGDILATRSGVIVSDVLWARNNWPKGLERRLRRMFGGRIVRLHDAPEHHIGMYAAPLDGRTVVVGDPSWGKKLWTDRMDAKLGHADFSRDAVAPFEQAAKQLKAAGFHVCRVPLVVLGPQTYVTYTNGVFEVRGGKKIVYAPWYDEPSLDKAAQSVYESEGWEVRPVPVRSVYRFRGTIGCLVNVLERR